MFIRADKFALPNRLAWILFLVHKRSLYSLQNAAYDTLSNELAKLLYLSGRSIWQTQWAQRLSIKSMFSTTSCVCNLGSLNKRWYTLWLKIAITCLSNTHFTCKIIPALYIWHIRAGKRPQPETVPAPVSYRSSRRRRQRKRLLLKVPNNCKTWGKNSRMSRFRFCVNN